MTSADRIAAAQRILSGAAITPDTAALAHALLAVAEALRETRKPQDTPSDAPHATLSDAQHEQVPQDQPDPDKGWPGPPDDWYDGAVYDPTTRRWT